MVLTVRDLARQLPSSWQEDLKAGGTTALAPYLRRAPVPRERAGGSHPWIHLDPPMVLRRWADTLSPERVHVVTVPPAGSPTDPPARAVRQGARGRPGPLRTGGRAEQLEPRPGPGGGAAAGERRAARGGAPPVRLQGRGEAVVRLPGARTPGEPQDPGAEPVPILVRRRRRAADRRARGRRVPRRGLARRAASAPTLPSSTTSGDPPSARSRRPR